MFITPSASKAILEVMQKKGLDAKNNYLEIGIFDGKNFGIGFTRDKFGTIFIFGELTVILDYTINADNLVVDFVESNNKKGLVFYEEKGKNHVNNSN